ncbi:hypothetical protein BJ742DRAFT_829931 [Cladochytrium replicatum]|nr:hypothetical protein BJ742DRAFT_829931 [Cladochytrium replicatum]
MNPLDFESESDEDVLKKQTEEQTMVSRSSAITNLPKMLDLLFFQSDSEDDIQTVRSCSTIKPRNTGTSKEQTRRRKVVERHLGEYGSQEANRGAQFLDDQTENDCHGQAQVVGHENGNDLQETNHDVKVKDDQKPFSQPIETPPAFEAVENPSEGNMTGTLANGPQKVLARSSEGIIRKSSLQLNREIPKLHLRDDPAASGKSGWDSPSWELPLLLPVKFAPRFVQDPFVQVSNEPRDPSRRREIKFSRIFDNVPECRAVEMESVNTVNLGTHTEISVGTIYHLNDAESLSPSPTEPSNEPLSVNNSSDLIDHGATGEETNRILGILCFKAAAAEVSIRASEVKETKPDSFAKQNSSQLGIQLQTMVGVGTTITVNDQIVIPPQKYSESPTQLKGATVSEGDSPSQSLTPNDAKFSREPLVAQNFAGAVATNTTARKPSITTHVSTSTSPFKQTGHTEKIEASTSWVLHLQFTPQHSYTFQLRDVGRSERLHILIAAYIVDALCPVLNETGDNVSGTGQLGKVSLCKEFICIVGKPMRQALVK